MPQHVMTDLVARHRFDLIEGSFIQRHIRNGDPRSAPMPATLAVKLLDWREPSYIKMRSVGMPASTAMASTASRTSRWHRLIVIEQWRDIRRANDHERSGEDTGKGAAPQPPELLGFLNKGVNRDEKDPD